MSVLLKMVIVSVVAMRWKSHQMILMNQIYLKMPIGAIAAAICGRLMMPEIVCGAAIPSKMLIKGLCNMNEYAALIVGFVLAGSQGATWKAVTPQTMLSDVDQIVYSSPPGSVSKSSASLPAPERCHQRRGYEISFSLSCASERERGFNSTL